MSAASLATAAIHDARFEVLVKYQRAAPVKPDSLEGRDGSRPANTMRQISHNGDDMPTESWASQQSTHVNACAAAEIEDGCG